MPTLWTQRYAQRTERMHRSALDELLRPMEPSAVISFAGGLPATDMFPLTEVQEACQRVLAEHGARALQYGPTQGYRPLREMITRHTARYGITITPDNVLVTSGSQQALDVLGKVFLNPGDRILVEAPTHVGALQAWQSYQPMVLVCYKPYNIIELYKLRVHVFELAVVLRFFHADILAHPTLRGEPYVHRGVYHRVVL